MEKTARKPSTDPVQEKLRQNKALWNKDVSMFINDLIHLKKTMNGWPSKFFQERSTIKEPIPADPPTLIGSLAGDFQELAERANKIVSEQLEYSKTRRKKQPKQLNLPLPPSGPKPEPEAPKPDLSQQLSFPNMASSQNDLVKLASAFESKYDLESEASNPFSRMWFRATTPRIGFGKSVQRRRARRTMLDSALESRKALKKFQVLILKSSDASIHDSYQKMQLAWDEFQTALRTYVDYKKDAAATQGELESNLSEQDRTQSNLDNPETGESPELEGGVTIPPTPPPPPSPEPPTQQAHDLAISDYLNHRDMFRSHDSMGIFPKLDAVIDAYTATRKKRLSKSFDSLYAKALESVSKGTGIPGSSFLDISGRFSVANKNAAAQIEKVAQDFLKKWIGKGRHQFLPGKTSDQRLRSFKMADSLLKKLNEIMDEIQGSFRFEALDPLLKNTSEEMNALKGMVRNLYNVSLRHKKQDKPSKGKK